MTMKVALVYDRVNKWGGAERVLLTLHEMFPRAPLYTSVYDPVKAPWAKVFPEVVTSFLQKVPGAVKSHEYFATLMPLAFEQFDFSSFDLVISVTSEAAKGIITKPGTLHICYCLTPTRYLWSGYELYFKNKYFKNLVNPIINYLRGWDKIAAQRPDVVIAISTAVQKRIKLYYGLDSKVIFPPVNFSISKRVVTKDLPSKYYLVVSRLVPYKKIEIAIEAFNKLGTSLVVAGSGSEEKRLKDMSLKNVIFTGQLTDEELSDYYEKCTAVVFPQEEDFGIVAVEAQLFGKPVIAYKAGGALETVIPGETGVFFENQNPNSLIKAIKRFENLPAGKAGMRFETQEIIKNAERFSKSRFKKEFLQLVKNI